MEVTLDPISVYLQIAQMVITTSAAIGAIVGVARWLGNSVNKTFNTLNGEIETLGKSVYRLSERVDRLYDAKRGAV